jgi:hypothetical protein
MLNQPFNIVVGNPMRFAQAVWLAVNARDANGQVVQVPVDFNQGGTIQPHEEKKVTLGTRRKRCFGCFGSASAASALLLIAGIAFIGRRVWRN